MRHSEKTEQKRANWAARNQGHDRAVQHVDEESGRPTGWRMGERGLALLGRRPCSQGDGIRPAAIHLGLRMGAAPQEYERRGLPHRNAETTDGDGEARRKRAAPIDLDRCLSGTARTILLTRAERRGATNERITPPYASGGALVSAQREQRNPPGGRLSYAQMQAHA
ncbi:MAG: hypothetical protein Q9159_007757, partial [Coniocarpon cinnabarinum]